MLWFDICKFIYYSIYMFLQQILKVIWKYLLLCLGNPLDYITNYNFDEVSSVCNGHNFRNLTNLARDVVGLTGCC